MHFILFVILFIIRWGALIIAILSLLSLIDKFDVVTLVLLAVCLAIFVGIGKANIYSPVNYNDIEYSENGKKPYDTHIEHDTGNSYTIQTKDIYGDEGYMNATKKGNEFIVDDDDISDNYQDWVTDVKFKVTNMGQNLQEFDYVKYSKKPHKGKVQRLIRQLN